MDSFFVFLLTIFGIWQLIRMATHASVEPEEYLQVLDPTEWKDGREIQKAMEELKGGWLNPMEVYQALYKLKGQELAEDRIVEDRVGIYTVYVTQFRSKSNWRPRKTEPRRVVIPKFGLSPVPAH